MICFSGKVSCLHTGNGIENIRTSSFIIRILPGANKPYYLKKLGPEGGIFVRIGSTNRKADSQVAAELRRQARNISLDQEIDPSFDCDILDMS